MPSSAALRPVVGDARAIEAALGDWVTVEHPAPLSVRTSGSSGTPKDVVLSQAAVRASALATLDRVGGAGRWLLALPAHYVAGLQVIVRSLLAGTSPVLLDEHAGLVEAASALGPGRRYVSVVPTQLHRWLDDPAAADALASFDAVLLGGAAAPPGLVDRARAAGIAITTTYGMSETCGGCVYDGVALDGVAVALSAEGRIRLAGPVLFDGYDGRPDLTREVLADGWLTTPDLGHVDLDGRLVVTGRADDVVLSGGVNVSLGAVEAALADLPGIASCAVVATPDDEWGSVVTAVVATAGGPAPTLAEVRDAVSRTLPREWAPRRLVAVDALPLLESGKADRVALARLAGGER